MQEVSPVPYFDLRRQYHQLVREFQAALCETAASGAYILSDKVRQFEADCCKYFQSPLALGVGSGTDALVLSLKALGVGKGDEVIVPSFTFVATAFAVIHAGAVPVFAEVDPITYTLDPISCESRVTKRTKAILPVHLYGQAADMKPLIALAQKYRLKVVEDTCQSHGAVYQGQKAGTFGDAGCFSFYPTKNLGAMGDGGLILLKNQKAYDAIARYRNLGRKDVSESHRYVGYTSRLDALQAAILQIKLKHLDQFNKARRQAAEWYGELLGGTPLKLPVEAQGRYHVYHLYVVRVPEGKRDMLQEYLKSKGVGSMIHYQLPVHKQPALKPYAAKTKSLKTTDRLCKEILSLPMFPEITRHEVERTVSAIRSFYKL